MAAGFPFLGERNFEVGVSGFTSETDTEAKLSVEHCSALATRGLTPYRGAFAAYCDLRLGAADAFFQEDTSFDLALDGSFGFRMFLWVDSLTMAASDTFTVAALQSAGDVDELTISILNSAGTYRIVASETSGGATSRATDLIQGKWHCIELYGDLDAGGGNDGTFTFAVDGEPIGAQVTTLNQAAVAQLRVGAMNIDVGTTRGRIVIDDISLDDARIGPELERFPVDMIFTTSGHLFVGPGAVASAALFSTGSTDTLFLYDTDTGTTTTPQAKKLDLSVGATTAAAGPIPFIRGCYVALAGTNPRGQVSVLTSSSDHGATFSGPLYYSHSGYKDHAAQRSQRAGNA